MQITKVRQEVEFKPIEIKLCIESEIEYEALKGMVVLDESIPSLFNDAVEKRVIKKFLAQLRTELYS